MRVSEIVSTRTLKATHDEVASNKIPYLGVGLFPVERKMGIDIKQIHTAKGLPVTLNPSAYDTVSAIRSREGFKVSETEMAFFKESMLVKEKDKIELARVLDANDPYAIEIYKGIFNDFEALYDSADVVAERMRMQLLSSNAGHPSIALAGDGATYEYNYDPDGEYARNNYEELLTTNKWDAATAKPITDIKRWQKAVRKKSGVTPAFILLNDDTFANLVQNEQIQKYALAQNLSPNVVIDEDVVTEVIKKNCKVTPIVYDKMFKNESGNEQYFYPEGFVALLPPGALGTTYYGTTPDEIEKINGAEIDTQVFDNKVTVTVTHTSDPAHDKTTVSETLLPSFEQMFYTFTAKVY